MYQLVEKNINLFLETKNPLYAWKAIEHARGFNYPIPNELLNFLFETAHAIIKIAQNPPRPAQRPLAIAKALKLHKTGAGQGSAFTDYSRRLQDRKLALVTAEKIDYYGPEKADYAFDDIAKEHGISKSTVRRNFLAHSRQWHFMAEKLIKSGDVTLGPTVKLEMTICGTADDLRETAEILKEIGCINATT
jgi:hypothetical protein